MIITTVGKILEAVPILREISNYEFRAKVAFKIVKIIQESEKEIKNFEQARNILFKQYGELDENDNLIVQDQSVVIKKDCIENYNQEMMDLLNTEVELVANTIQLEEIEEMRFTPLQLTQISDFITE